MAERDELRKQLQDSDDALAACQSEAGGKISTLEHERDEMAGRFSRLLYELTDGNMSKTNYTVEAMLGEIERVRNRDKEPATPCAFEAEARELVRQAEHVFIKSYMCHGVAVMSPCAAIIDLQHSAKALAAKLPGGTT